MNRGKVACRPGQNCPGLIKQEELPTPRLERPRESGDQKRRRHEAQAKVVQRWSHDRVQVQRTTPQTCSDPLMRTGLR